ncbi:hypothetical protein Sjap_022418 [Stephania japonica]|uniref:Uncharacterized protein n=1 Tax=Stephania japonica TaxID=461633 RepID=A0AAP0ENV5_9MAGN
MNVRDQAMALAVLSMASENNSNRFKIRTSLSPRREEEAQVAIRGRGLVGSSRTFIVTITGDRLKKLQFHHRLSCSSVMDLGNVSRQSTPVHYGSHAFNNQLMALLISRSAARVRALYLVISSEDLSEYATSGFG